MVLGDHDSPPRSDISKRKRKNEKKLKTSTTKTMRKNASRCNLRKKQTNQKTNIEDPKQKHKEEKTENKQ